MPVFSLSSPLVPLGIVLPKSLLHMKKSTALLASVIAVTAAVVLVWFPQDNPEQGDLFGPDFAPGSKKNSSTAIRKPVLAKSRRPFRPNPYAS